MNSKHQEKKNNEPKSTTEQCRGGQPQSNRVAE